MYKIRYSFRFKKSYKRVSNNVRFKEETYTHVVGCLVSKKELEPKYRNHKLKGDMEGVWECHLAPDILLMYTYIESELVLMMVNIGTHSDLFD